MIEHSVVVKSVRLNPVGSQFLIPVFSNLCSQSVVAYTVSTQLRTPTLAVRVQLQLGWNTCVFFNTDIVNFDIVLLIFVLWRCLNLRWMRGGGLRL